MQFVMSLSMGAAMGMAPSGGAADAMGGMGQGQQQWGGGGQDSGKQGWGGNGRGNGHSMRGTGRGRGGFHGNGRDNQRAYNAYSSNDQGTDAIVLGGGDDSTQAMDITPAPTPALVSSGGGGGGGKMQKVGDKWVFVRNV